MKNKYLIFTHTNEKYFKDESIGSSHKNQQ